MYSFDYNRPMSFLWSIFLVTVMNIVVAWLLRFIITRITKDRLRAEVTYLCSFIPMYFILLLATSFSNPKGLLMLIPYSFFLLLIFAQERKYSKDIQKILLLISIRSVSFVGFLTWLFAIFLLLFATFPAFITYLILMFFETKRLKFSITVVDLVSHHTIQIQSPSWKNKIFGRKMPTLDLNKFSERHKFLAPIASAVISGILINIIWSIINYMKIIFF
jgi:hypothetical protein